jgi:adenosylcobyric acid synthase
MSGRSLMVMGTASDVGKSVIVTALCRLFARAGIRVAPFKAQNMSNNAAVCVGGEIGRAQAVQAEACGLEPEFEVIVIEGAGGAAEINLRNRDIVNWPIAELADAPVLIVADIDKGGALASLVGTVALLSPAERQRVKGLIIKKFRGDPELLYDGLGIIEERTAIAMLGVLPHAGNLAIPGEDAAGLNTGMKALPDGAITIGVVVFPRIANYTDFEPFIREPDVSLQYIEDPRQVGALDVLCLPGTKSISADLAWLRAA